MRYVDATKSLTRELARGGSFGAVRAGLRLVALAWRELGDTDPGWDQFGLQVLAAEELLRGLPMSVVACAPPDRADPEVPRALASLLGAVADLLELGSQDATGTVADRLAFDAAAAMLRRAIGRLP